MTKEEIFNILKNALIDMFEIDIAKITPNALVYEDLEIDSIDAIDLVDFIRKQTGHRLLPQDFKNVKTLQDIVDCVYQKFQNQDKIENN